MGTYTHGGAYMEKSEYNYPDLDLFLLHVGSGLSVWQLALLMLIHPDLGLYYLVQNI